MYLDKEKKTAIFKQYAYTKFASDTGSPESQIALFTYRIKHLTKHLEFNKKDYSTQLGLIKLIGKRRKLLKYLQNKDINRYRNIIKELGIRK